MKIAKRLLSYALPYRSWLLLALGMILFTSLVINYLPVLIQRITDQCLMNTAQPPAERIELLLRLSLVYIVLAGVGHSVRYFQGVLTTWIGQKIIYNLRLEVFAKVLRMPQAYFDHTAVGTLMSRVTSDIERLQHFVTEGVVGTIADLFMLFGIMGYMIYISPLLSFAIFLSLPPLVGIMFFINSKLRNANRDIRDRQSKLNALLQEDITGMTTIQLFNREQRAQEDFDKCHTHLRSAYFDEVNWFSLYFPTVEGGQALAILLILTVGGLFILQGSETITLGVFVAFLAYIRDFFRPLGSLSDKAGSFQVALASVERIFLLLDTEEEIKDISHPVSSDRLAGTICFDRVWFAYEGENWVIKDLSLSLEPGQVLAVVGATGAGKSTIINLLGRFYEPQRGSITIDGVDIRDFKKADLRKQLGYVFQDPFIFTGTVAENIALFAPHISQETICHAATMVNAHHFIEEMPSQYETQLNERGAGLSLGQKQLLAMARMLAQDPGLLFILDEATASIDTASEVLIQDALKKLVANRTSIVIAHRLSTIRQADQILVMRKGALVEQGTHEDLLTKEGYYFQLYKLLQHAPNL